MSQITIRRYGVFSTVPDYEAVCAATSYALQDALRKATFREVR